jgi:hypothetical protein
MDLVLGLAVRAKRMELAGRVSWEEKGKNRRDASDDHQRHLTLASNKHEQPTFGSLFARV